MGIRKYKICECCEQELPANRTFFKRRKNKETGKEELIDVCRECEEKISFENNWKDGKLKCFICGQYKDPQEFNQSQSYEIRGHKECRCRSCKTQANRIWRDELSDNDKLDKVLQDRWLNAKTRAESKNIPFTITKDFLRKLWKEQLGLCAVSKIPMTYELGQGRVFSNVSIDQIKPGQGYTCDNVQLICSAVNQLKSNWDKDTVLYICNQVINNY